MSWETLSTTPSSYPPRIERARTVYVMNATMPSARPSDELIINMWLSDRPYETYRAYERAYRQFRLCINGPLLEVTEEDIRTFAEAQRQRGLRARYCTFAAIRALFAFLQSQGLREDNPVKNVKLHERYINRERQFEIVFAALQHNILQCGDLNAIWRYLAPDIKQGLKDQWRQIMLPHLSGQWVEERP